MNSERTILITGSSDGIGLATALCLATLGHEVLLHGRDSAKLNSAKDLIFKKTGRAPKTVRADLSSMKEVLQLADFVNSNYLKLDTLINNAGGLFPNPEITIDGFEKTLAVNHLAHFLLSLKLALTLERSKKPRIININSKLYKSVQPSFNDLNSTNDYKMITAYSRAKLYNVYMTLAWQTHLPESRIEVVAVHPGFINTNLARNIVGPKKIFFSIIRNLFFSSPANGAQTVVHLATQPVLDVHHFYVKSKQQAYTDTALSLDSQKKMWDYSDKLLKSWI